MAKYKDKAKKKLNKRIQLYLESIKRVRHPQGFKKPGSLNIKK